MLLRITKEDIDQAKQRVSIWHPFYLAIHRQTGWSYAYSDGFLWPVCGEPVAVPPDLKAWAHGYICGRNMQPTEVEIDLPCPVGCGRRHLLRETWFDS